MRRLEERTEHSGQETGSTGMGSGGELREKLTEWERRGKRGERTSQKANSELLR